MLILKRPDIFFWGVFLGVFLLTLRAPVLPVRSEVRAFLWLASSFKEFTPSENIPISSWRGTTMSSSDKTYVQTKHTVTFNSPKSSHTQKKFLPQMRIVICWMNRELMTSRAQTSISPSNIMEINLIWLMNFKALSHLLMKNCSMYVCNVCIARYGISTQDIDTPQRYATHATLRKTC